jgi:hypothetical protein
MIGIEKALLLLLPPAYFFINRWRGTLGWGGILHGLLTAAIVFALTFNYIMAIAMGVLVALGEMWGWGKWVGNILAYWDKDQAWYNANRVQIDEGKDNGVHFVANKIVKETEDFKGYTIAAMCARSLLWWAPVLLTPLFFGANPIFVALAIVLITPAFFLGMYLSRNGEGDTWAQGERYYGIMQGIALALVLLTI